MDGLTLLLIILIIPVIAGSISSQIQFRRKTKRIIADKDEQVKERHKELENANQQLKESILSLQKEEEAACRHLEDTQAKKNHLQNDFYELQKEQTTTSTLNNQLKSINDSLQDSQNKLKEGFANQAELLESKYEQVEQDYDNMCKKCSDSYEDLQEQKMNELAELAKEIQDYKNRLHEAAAILRKQQEEAEDMSKQQLPIGPTELSDIQMLHNIRSNLNNPRILDMLIWSTFFQKSMTQLCNNVLGVNTICGIYKITNQLTKECQIGQAVDVAKRWKDHAKCGLGIDTPQGNKLYAAMLKDGIWNFSWELITSCSKDELNEKERYYIDLFDSKNYGYNTLMGKKS